MTRLALFAAILLFTSVSAHAAPVAVVGRIASPYDALKATAAAERGDQLLNAKRLEAATVEIDRAWPSCRVRSTRRVASAGRCGGRCDDRPTW